MANAEIKTSPNAEEVVKSALAAKETELETVRKELADAKAGFAVELAKYLPKPEPVLPVDVQKRLDAADARAVEVEKKLAAEVDRREEAEAIEKARTFPPIGMPVEKVAKVLRLIRKALPEADATEVEQALQAAGNQTKANTTILREIGQAGANVDPNAPEAQLEAAVNKFALETGKTRSVAYAEITKAGQGAALLQQIRKNEHDAAKAKG